MTGWIFKEAARLKIENVVCLKGGRVAQWLGRRISDKGSLVRTQVGAHFVVALSKSHLPCSVLVEPRKRWTDDRLGHTVTRLDITLCLMW